MFRQQLESVGVTNGDASFIINPSNKANYGKLGLIRRNLVGGLPARGLPQEVNEWRTNNFKNLKRGLLKLAFSDLTGTPHFYGVVSFGIQRPKVSKRDINNLLAEYKDQQLYPIPFPYWAKTKYGIDIENVYLGTGSFRVVTTVGVGFIVDAFQDSVELEIMKYHGIGTGGTAENVADTDLVTELTTQYNVDNTRATGSLTEGASGNIFRTVGTNTVDATVAIVEHGILSSATVAAGVLIDRTVVSTINLTSGDSLQSTYDLTLTAGS